MSQPSSDPSKCPTRETLTHMVLGQLPEVDLAALESHLISCPPCVETLCSLRVEDTFVEALRLGSPSKSASVEPIIDELAERIKTSNLGHLSGVAHVTRDEASSGHQSAKYSMAPSTDADDEAASFDYLNPPQTPDELGRLGSYRILDLLGTGGMGIVFLAEDIQLHRRVALKVMKPHLAVQTDARKRFLREARAAAAIVSDHIVTIHQVGEDRGLPFMAMAFLQGETLDARLRREPRLTLEEVLQIVRQTADGIAAAHEHGLLHRDIKPANIWLEKLPGSNKVRVKILDFGLARLESEQSSVVTQEGAIVGTPAYMAPEQAQGGPIDYRCDLFSLGCVFYHLATSKLPFRGSTPLETLMKVVSETPRTPSALNPDLPASVSDLIARLMNKTPSERPRSTREVIAAIEKMETQCGLTRENNSERSKLLATVSPAKAKAEFKAVSRPESQARAKAANPSQRSRRILLAIATGVVLIFACWAGFQVFRIQTDRGTLIVEINDAAVEAKLQQTGLVIVDTRTGRQFTISAQGPRNPRSGDYKVAGAEGLRLLVVDDQGMEVETSEFKLARHGSVRIRVAMESTNPTNASNFEDTAAADPSSQNKPGDAFSPEHNEADFVELFNGKDFTGWESDTDIGKFRVDPNEKSIIVSGDRPNAKDWLFTARDYQDYVLRLEFMVDPANDPVEMVRSNIALRGQWDNARPRHAEIGVVIGNGKSPGGIEDATLPGTIVWAITGRKEASSVAPIRSAGQWNQVELHVVGTRIRVRLNGFDVNDLDLSSVGTTDYLNRPWVIESLKLRSGRIGISSARNVVQFRNIRVKELANANTAAASADRLAAEWAIGRGATLSLVRNGNYTHGINDLSQLPNDTFQISEICFLHGSSFPADSELKILVDCQALRLLLFETWGPGLSDEGLALLSQIKSLEDVRGNFSRVTGTGLVPWGNHPSGLTLGLFQARLDDDDLLQLANIERLENLIIQGSQITADGLEHLTQHPKLRHLELVSQDQIPDGILDEAACQAISKITTLEHLCVAADHLTDAGAQTLATLPNLTELWLFGAVNLTDSVCPAISKLSNLQNLRVTDSHCGGRLLSELAAVPNLKTLDLSGTTFQHDGVAALSSLRNVESLALSRSNLKDADLANLVSLDTLRSLHLMDTAITDDAIVSIQNMKGLSELVLTGTKLSPQGIASLKMALPECNIIP